MARGTTRRRLLGRAIAAAPAACLLSPATSLLAAPAARAQPQSDADLLTNALAVQQLEVYAYRRLLASTALDGDAGALVTHLLALEVQHAAAIGAEVERLGGTVPSGPADLATADRELARHPVAGRLAGTRSQHDCVKLLIDLESVAEGACYAAIMELSDAGVARLAAEVMSSEAQQWTLLDQLQHRDVIRAVPGPFVEGTK